MTAKQKSKNNQIDNNSHTNQDDVAIKENRGGEARGSGSGSWAKVLAALCYIVLVAAAGSSALYFQRVLEEMGQISRRTEASVHKNAELALRLDSVLQQVDSLRGAVERFGPAVESMRAQLEAVGQAQRSGEEAAGRTEETLRSLRREVLQDLSRGLREAQEARGRDSEAQERAFGAGLEELTRSVRDSLAQVAGAQADARAQIGELSARLDGVTDPVPLRRELAVVAVAVDELRAANQRAEAGARSLSDRMGSLGAELESTNRNAARAAGEAESARTLVASVAGELERSVAGVQGGAQALSVQAGSLRVGLEEAHSSLQSAGERLQEVQARAGRLGQELGARLGAAEGTVDALRGSEETRHAGLASLLSRADSQETALATLRADLQSARSAGQSEAAAVLVALGEEERVRGALAGQVEALRSDLGELRGAADILNGTQAEQAARDSGLALQAERLGQRLAALGEALSEAQASSVLKAQMAQQRVRRLMTTVDSLLLFSDRVKGHVDAITSLQSALEETNASVSSMSKKQKVPDAIV